MTVEPAEVITDLAKRIQVRQAERNHVVAENSRSVRFFLNITLRLLNPQIPRPRPGICALDQLELLFPTAEIRYPLRACKSHH